MSSTPAACQPPDSQVVIRRVEIADSEQIYRHCLTGRTFEDVYQLITRTRRYITQGRGMGVVAVGDDGQVAGYGQFTVWPTCGEISDLSVTEKLRGRGIGTAIIQYLTKEARRMDVRVLEIGAAVSNPRAMALYRRLGFVDSHTLMLDLGHGREEVLFLRLEMD